MNVERLLKKLDAMPGTNVDLKDAVRKKLCAQRNEQAVVDDYDRQTVLFPECRSLPYAKGSDTSREAAESMKPVAGDLRERVYRRIKESDTDGITCDALEVALGLSHQTCSARVNELRNAGRIVDSGLRKRTRSGRKAVVYTVAR